MPHDIFISHAAKDSLIADAICQRLEQRHMPCWIAPRDVRPGYPYPGEIARAIAGSKVMVLVLSSASNVSDHVMREVGLAADCRIHIVQFCIENVRPSDDLSYYLSLPHRVHALDGPIEAHLDSLEKAIAALLETWSHYHGPTTEQKVEAARIEEAKKLESERISREMAERQEAAIQALAIEAEHKKAVRKAQKQNDILTREEAERNNTKEVRKLETQLALQKAVMESAKDEKKLGGQAVKDGLLGNTDDCQDRADVRELSRQESLPSFLPQEHISENEAIQADPAKHITPLPLWKFCKGRNIAILALTIGLIVLILTSLPTKDASGDPMENRADLKTGTKRELRAEHRNVSESPPAPICTYWSSGILQRAGMLTLKSDGELVLLADFAAKLMFTIHGSKWMVIRRGDSKEFALDPTAWIMETAFRPEVAIKYPTFLVADASVAEKLKLESRGDGALYSYSEIELVRDRLIEHAKNFEKIDPTKRTSLESQIVDLGYAVRNYESLVGYFSFARSGVTLAGTGDGVKPDKVANISDVMKTASTIRAEIALAKQAGKPIDNNLNNLLEQFLDAANSSKYLLTILPPTGRGDTEWRTAGNALMSVITLETKGAEVLIDDITAMEDLARSLPNMTEFEAHLVHFQERLSERENRAKLRE